MLICMAGPPQSGKTTFVKELCKQLPDRNIKIVDPSEYLPPEFYTLSEQFQKDYRVAAWNVCLEYVRELMVEPPSTIIIYDTCASKFLPIQPVLTDAMVNKHKIVYVFVNASKSECRQRAGENWCGDDVFDKYTNDFKMSVPDFKEVANHTIVVKSDVTVGVQKIVDLVDK